MNVSFGEAKNKQRNLRLLPDAVLRLAMSCLKSPPLQSGHVLCSRGGSDLELQSSNVCKALQAWHRNEREPAIQK